ENAERWKTLIADLSQEAPQQVAYRPEEWEPLLLSILHGQAAGEEEPGNLSVVRPAGRVRTIRKWWYAAAALLIMAAGAALVMMLGREQDHRPAVAGTGEQQDIVPGRNQAVLTLADGRKIILDSAANGLVAQQGNASVVKLDGGQLLYKTAGEAAPETLFNTMTTPKGGQYKLLLPDGTAVWLNAASSITYPAAFSGARRLVTITGEAYFEVAKDASQPFLVRTGATEVEVLGTHFNINSYDDEPAMAATLLEGSVRVTYGPHQSMLKPGQQARVQQPSIRVVNDVDVDQVVAWKNGFFQFDRTDIRTVMRQLSRWYDVEVVYEGEMPRDRFGGRLPRDARLSEVLRALEQTQVHFRIEGKKIIVMP
ncbi:MAG: FecR domain-containing protein, partial [Chitinophagaceae bacterium]